MFNKILVVADGTDHSEKAVKLAGDLAAKYDADLTVVHVLGHGEISKDFLRTAETENLAPVSLYNDVTLATKGVKSYEISYKVHEQVGEHIGLLTVL